MLCVLVTYPLPEIPSGQPKLRSNVVVQQISKRWREMDKETQVVVTNPLMDGLIAAQEEAETKVKIVPVHILNNVTVMISKITCEVCVF
jgi:hypothetical protein